MKRVQTKAILFVTLLVNVVGPTSMAGASEPTADAARTVLQSRAFPWYDSTKDSFRRVRPYREEPTRSNGWQWGTDSIFAQFPQILMWILLATLIAVVLIMVIRSAQNFEPRPDQPDDPAEAKIDLETLEALPEPTRGVRDLLGEAARLASQSSFGTAMTFYYSWQLLQLDQQQLIEIQKGKTNRQYSREVGTTKPELSELFGQSIRLFEETFFGNLEVSRDDFQQVWNQRDKFNVAPRRTRV